MHLTPEVALASPPKALHGSPLTSFHGNLRSIARRRSLDPTQADNPTLGHRPFESVPQRTFAILCLGASVRMAKSGINVPAQSHLAISRPAEALM